MKGKIIDKNLTEAFVALETGDTIGVKVVNLPKDSKVGDTVNVHTVNGTFSNNTSNSIHNNKLVDFF